MSSLTFTATTLDGPQHAAATAGGPTIDSRVVEFLQGCDDPVRLREVTAAVYGRDRAGKNPESTTVYARLRGLAEHGVMDRVTDEGGVYRKYRIAPCPIYDQGRRRGRPPRFMNAILRFLYENPGPHTAMGVTRGLLAAGEKTNRSERSLCSRVFVALKKLYHRGYVRMHQDGRHAVYELAPPGHRPCPLAVPAARAAKKGSASGPGASLGVLAKLVREQQRLLGTLADSLEALAGQGS